MSKKITKEEFELLYDEEVSKKKYDDLMEKLEDRVKEICDAFLVKIENYRWGGGRLNKQYLSLENDTERIPFECYGHVDIPEEDCDVKDSEFPVKWLWDDDGEFEEKYAKAHRELLAKEKKAKEDIKNAKDTMKQKLYDIQTSLEQKLLPEELKHVSLKRKVDFSAEAKAEAKKNQELKDEIRKKLTTEEFMSLNFK